MRTPETIALAKDIFKQTWPMVFGILSLMSFQLADSTFISQLGVLPLAAQGFTMPLQMASLSSAPKNEWSHPQRVQALTSVVFCIK